LTHDLLLDLSSITTTNLVKLPGAGQCAWISVLRKRKLAQKAVYDLAAFQATFKSVEKLAITTTALKSAADLGFGRQEIVETIQTMQPQHFYQSMTSYADHRI
jgi:hypothetical protein